MRVAIAISGRGSNMSALIRASQRPGCGWSVVGVVSDRADAAGLGDAREAGIEAVALDRSGFAGRASFEAALDRQFQVWEADLICLAGFMRLLSAAFCERWRDRLINIHPSLLPAFKGLDTHRRALEAGVRWHGATVHFVRPAMDDGPIIVQAAVPVDCCDTQERLSERVLEAEHRIYPLAVDLIAEGRVRMVEGAPGREICRIAGSSAVSTPAVNPPG